MLLVKALRDPVALRYVLIFAIALTLAALTTVKQMTGEKKRAIILGRQI